MVKSSSVQRSSKNLVTSVESSHPGIVPPVKSFVLKSNDIFADRASDVFNRLSSLENEHSIWITNNETHGSFEADVSTENIPGTSKTDTFKKPCTSTVDSFKEPSSSTTDTFKEPSSSTTDTFIKPSSSTTDTFIKPSSSTTDTFKKPYLPVHRHQKHNFIRKNSSRRVWRKYSLKDIPLTSDAKNAAVAFQFLNELRKKREESSCNETAPDDVTVTFRKPVKKNLLQSTSSCNKASSSSKTVIEKLPKSINCSIKLDHLEDEPEDE